MQQLIDTLTMSSREIAELSGRAHDNVRRDIKNMGEELSLTFEEKTEPSNGGRPSKVFMLTKRETLILVSGYSVKLRAKIIDRWQELEDAARKPPAMPPLPDTDMLNALLVMYLQRVLQNGAGLAAMPQLPPSTISADKLAHNVIEHREGERLHGVRRRVTLSPEQWETILDTVERGEESMAQLAREYGIAGSTISHRMTMRRQMRLAPVPTQAAAAPEEDGGFSITAAAKSLTVSPKTLFRWLAGHRWIYKRAIGSPWVAYQDKLDSGLLRQRQLTINHDNGRARLTTQVLVTPKGMARLVKDMVVR